MSQKEIGRAWRRLADKMPHKILIADRFPLHREGLKIALNSGPEYLLFNAHSVSSIDEVLRQIRRRGGYNLLIMDLELLEQAPEWTLKELVSQTCIPTLLMCNQATSALIRDARQAGIRGVLPRDASMKTINQVVHTLLSGKTYWPDLCKRSAANGMPAELPQISSDDLTDQQLQIIQLIVDGMLNKQISYELGIHESTVKYHLTNIYRKFQVRSRTQLVVSARNAGVLGLARL